MNPVKAEEEDKPNETLVRDEGEGAPQEASSHVRHCGSAQ